jgi:hypothetical protein
MDGIKVDKEPVLATVKLPICTNTTRTGFWPGLEFVICTQFADTFQTPFKTDKATYCT